MSRAPNGTSQLSKKDKEVIEFVVKRKCVALQEVKRVFRLDKSQSAWIVHQLKLNASDTVSFSKEGRCTVLWSVDSAIENGVTHYTRPAQVKRGVSPWPFSYQEQTIAALSRELHSMWRIV